MRIGLIGVCAVLLCGVLAMEDADARRFGGGRSTGVQRSVPSTPPASTPARPAQQQAAPNQASQNQAAPGQAAATQAQPSGLSRWMPMLGGLALGGLLGYLFAGNGLGALLLFALLAVGVVLLFRALARRRTEAPQRMQYAGLGQGPVMAPPPSESGATPVASRGARLPEGFDAASFLRGAKMNFVRLQVANDRGNLEDIREFNTDQMFAELSKDVPARGGQSQQTDVENLQAEIAEVATEGERHWVSVRFSGDVREAPGTAPVPFTEVWHLVKPADGSSGWLLAGIQQVH
jgi:predicted lipid-binding transport protein (Tim44 family)